MESTYHIHRDWAPARATSDGPRVGAHVVPDVLRVNTRTAPTGLGAQLLDAAKSNWYGPRGVRGRSYANLGQVRNVVIDGTSITARVTGSGNSPYRVALLATSADFQGLRASCSCPYGSHAGNWCKHAVALVYVVAAYLSNVPVVSADGGAPPTRIGETVDAVATTALQRLAPRLSVPAPANTFEEAYATSLVTLAPPPAVRNLLIAARAPRRPASF